MSTQPSIYALVRDRVVNGEFEPNQRLRSNVLGDEYTISASRMREILFRLSTVGLVTFQEQRGFRVPAESRILRRDLAQFRIMLESEGAVLSIRTRDIDWESRLAASHHKLSHIESRIEKGDGADPHALRLWTRAEQEFHQTLIDACGSEVLKQSHREIYDRFRQQVISSDKKFAFVPKNVIQHQDILDAVLARDEALTRQNIHTHLSHNLRLS
jgi:DNA-binding GntR family transcriptional regulator